MGQFAVLGDAIEALGHHHTRVSPLRPLLHLLSHRSSTLLAVQPDDGLFIGAPDVYCFGGLYISNYYICSVFAVSILLEIVPWQRPCNNLK